MAPCRGTLSLSGGWWPLVGSSSHHRTSTCLQQCPLHLAQEAFFGGALLARRHRSVHCLCYFELSIRAQSPLVEGDNTLHKIGEIRDCTGQDMDRLKIRSPWVAALPMTQGGGTYTPRPPPRDQGAAVLLVAGGRRAALCVPRQLARCILLGSAKPQRSDRSRQGGKQDGAEVTDGSVMAAAAARLSRPLTTQGGRWGLTSPH